MLFNVLVSDDSRMMKTRPIGFVGNKYSLGCLSGGDTSWYYKNTASHPIATDDNMLRFDSITAKQTGDYYCYGRYPTTNKHFIAKQTVILYGECISHYNYTSCFFEHGLGISMNSFRMFVDKSFLMLSIGKR